jgi:hypothetical protein
MHAHSLKVPVSSEKPVPKNSSRRWKACEAIPIVFDWKMFVVIHSSAKMAYKISLSVFDKRKLPTISFNPLVYALPAFFLLHTLTTLLVFHTSITSFSSFAMCIGKVFECVNISDDESYLPQQRSAKAYRRWKRVERKSRHTHNRQQRKNIKKEFAFTLK